MAGSPRPLSHALHANLVILDEFGRALLPRPHRVHHREELCLDPRTGRCDHCFPGGAQRQSSTLRLEGQGRRHPAQDRCCQTGARRAPANKYPCFRDSTLDEPEDNTATADDWEEFREDESEPIRVEELKGLNLEDMPE